MKMLAAVLYALSLSACGATQMRPQADDTLSDKQVRQILEMANIKNPIKVIQDSVADDANPWMLLVTEESTSISQGGCIEQGSIIRVSREKAAIAEKESSARIAFESCEHAREWDFRRVSSVFDFDPKTIFLLSRLLKEDTACYDSRCVRKGNVTYEKGVAARACELASIPMLDHVAIESSKRVSYIFERADVAAEIMSCEFTLNSEGTWDLYGYRGNAPDPVVK